MLGIIYGHAMWMPRMQGGGRPGEPAHQESSGQAFPHQARGLAGERAATLWWSQTATNHRGPSVGLHCRDEREMAYMGALPWVMSRKFFSGPTRKWQYTWSGPLGCHRETILSTAEHECLWQAVTENSCRKRAEPCSPLISERDQAGWGGAGAPPQSGTPG